MMDRGVWVAPWIGPDGETVLVAIDRQHRIVGDAVLIPAGGAHLIEGDRLWDRLEREDPVPTLRVI